MKNNSEKSKKKKLRILIVTAAAVVIFLLSPLFPYVRSLAVMSVYSKVCEKESVPAENGFRVDIPSGEGWYPFVMNFSDHDGFSAYTGNENARYTIYYNFPAFSLTNGCSYLYDEDSPYYNSFYGAYFISGYEDVPYGFYEDENGNLTADSDAIADAARYDMFHLVLGEFGLKDEDRVFEYEETSIEDGLDFIGYEGCSRIECNMLINGASHNEDGFTQSYLQYGEPKFQCTEPFAPVQMHSITYARYFEEYDVSAFFYVMAPDADVCAKCENTILARSTISPQ